MHNSMRRRIPGLGSPLRSGSSQPSVRRRGLLVLVVLGAALLLPASGAPSAGPARPGFLGGAASAPAPAETLPSGFQDQVAFSGLTNPTSVRFSPDGRVFVAEKQGLVKVFDSLADPTPSVA